MPTTIKKSSFILGTCISNTKVKCKVFMSKRNVVCMCKTYQILFSEDFSDIKAFIKMN